MKSLVDFEFVKNIGSFKLMRCPKTLQARLISRAVLAEPIRTPVAETKPKAEISATETLKRYKNCEPIPREWRNFATEKLPPEPPKPMSFEERIVNDWKTNPDVRKEFPNFNIYAAYMRAENAGRARIVGGA